VLGPPWKSRHPGTAPITSERGGLAGPGVRSGGVRAMHPAVLHLQLVVLGWAAAGFPSSPRGFGLGRMHAVQRQAGVANKTAATW